MLQKGMVSDSRSYLDFCKRANKLIWIIGIVDPWPVIHCDGNKGGIL